MAACEKESIPEMKGVENIERISFGFGRVDINSLYSESVYTECDRKIWFILQNCVRSDWLIQTKKEIYCTIYFGFVDISTKELV